MSRACPDAAEWARQLDGEVTANRAAAMADHAAACEACRAEVRGLDLLARDLAAPPALRPDAVARIMAAIDAEPQLDSGVSASSARARRPPRRWVFAFVGGATAMAAAAAVALFVGDDRGGRSDGDDGTFQPRGEDSTASPLQRLVGVTILADGAQASAGHAVTAATGYTLRYRNRAADGAPSVYLLAFAVDAAGEVHWLFPGFFDPASDPAAVALAPGVDERAWPEGAILDAPAAGPLRLVTILATSPLRVSDVERLTPAERTTAALAHRFAGARVDELALVVEP